MSQKGIIMKKGEKAKINALKCYMNGLGLKLELSDMLFVNGVYNGFNSVTNTFFLAEITGRSSIMLRLTGLDCAIVQGFSCFFDLPPCCMYNDSTGITDVVVEWRRYKAVEYVKRLKSRGVTGLEENLSFIAGPTGESLIPDDSLAAHKNSFFEFEPKRAKRIAA